MRPLAASFLCGLILATLAMLAMPAGVTAYGDPAGNDGGYVCKIADDNPDGGQRADESSQYEHAFPTLNEALVYARSNKGILPMDADSPVTIQMLGDYTMPDSDQVTLSESTDNIVITTAAASGGVYNFVPTSEREDGDSEGAAILTRGWSGSTTANQALIYVNNASAKLTTRNVTLDGGRNAANDSGTTGRAIYANSGAIAVEGGSTFRDIYTTGNGGAIYANGSIAIRGTSESHVVFENCQAQNGGAIFQDSTGDLSVRYARFGALVGGAQSKGRLELDATDVDATKACRASGNNNGGAIYTDTIGALEVEGCQFYGAYGGNGGGIHMNHNGGSGPDSSKSLIGCDFIGCYASYQYGAALCDTWNRSGYSLSTTIRDSVFTDCTGKSYGGAVLDRGLTVTVEDSSFRNCYSGSNGGGGAISLYANRGSGMGPVTITRTSFEGCYHNANGGAILVGAEKVSESLTVSGCSFESCGVDAGNATKTAKGGAIYANATQTTIQGALAPETPVTAGTAVGRQAGADIDTTFYNCAASQSGGAVHATSLSLAVTGTKSVHCVVSNGNGGAINHDNSGANSADELRGCEFVNCQASGSGGALRSSAKSLVMQGCSFDGHDDTQPPEAQLPDQTKNAGSDGGGVYSMAVNADVGDYVTTAPVTGTQTVIQTIFRNLSASKSGSMFVNGEGGTVNIRHCEFLGSSATDRFGALGVRGNSSAKSGTLNIEGCRFDDCVASKLGGAFCTDLNVVNVRAFATTDGTVARTSFNRCRTTGNSDGYGGAFMADSNGRDSSVRVSDADFTDCSVQNQGGGAIDSRSYSLSCTGCSFTGCETASGNGGAIQHRQGSGSAGVTRCEFTGCSAKGTGGATHFGGMGYVGTGTSFAGCVAEGNGGGVYATSNLSIAGDVSFDGCKSSSSGGAAYDNGRLTLSERAPVSEPTAEGGQVDSKLGWRCDEEYFIGDSGQMAVISGRGYYRQAAIPAIGFIRKTPNGYWQPAFISTEPAAVTYNTSSGGGPWYYSGTFEYLGITWYYFQGNYGFTGGTIVSDLPRCDFAGVERTLAAEGLFIMETAHVQVGNTADLRTSNLSVTDCEAAGANGGGVYAAANAELLGGVTMSDCVAYTNGGGIYANNVLEIRGPDDRALSFSRCDAGANGGAIYANAAMTVASPQGGTSSFGDCDAEGSGGAIYANNKLSIDGGVTRFDGCRASLNGGAICRNGNAGNELSVSHAEFANCACDAAGGAIYTNLTTSANSISGSSFHGCRSTNASARGGGGAICKDNTGSLTIRDSAIVGCSSERVSDANAYDGGSAICIRNGNLYLIGTPCETGNPRMRIEGCVAEGVDYGAINLANDKKLFIEGDVVVSGNADATGDPHNVVLSCHNQGVINVSEGGIGENSSIGVYVTDPNMPYHGEAYTNFGTRPAAVTEHLSAFTNDRRTLVGGEGATSKDLAWMTAYQLVLNPNGGEGSLISVTLPYLREYKLGAPYHKDGYLFDGWNTRKDGTGKSYYASDIVSQLTQEDGGTVTLYAQWRVTDLVQIIFHPNGGEDLEPRGVRPGTPVGLLPSTRRDGYTFVRWKLVGDDGEVPYDKDTPVEHDMHMYAVWDKNIYVTFDANGGIVGEDVREMRPGAIGSLPKTDRPLETSLDYVFDGWYDPDGNKVGPGTSFDRNVTLTARWAVWQRRLRFDTNGGLPGSNLYTDYQTDLEAITNFVVTQEVIDALPEITNHGHAFDGWYTSRSGGTKVEVGDSVDLRYQDALHAHWVKGETVTVSFDSAGGAGFDPITVFRGDRIANLPEPKREGHSFLGWFSRTDEVSSLTPIESDMTLVAGWAPRDAITISFDSNGGSPCEPRAAYAGDYLTSPPTPTKEGATFAGWYDQNGKRYDARTMLTESMTLVARWIEKIEVMFDGNGNGESQVVIVDKGKGIKDLPGMSYAGYVLDGWYEDAQATGTKLTNLTPIDGPMTYYAHWVPAITTTVMDGITYEHSITWTTSSGTMVTNLGDLLHYSVSEGQNGNLTANAHFYFMVKDAGDMSIPEGNIRIKIPKYAFKDASGNGIGSNNAMSVIPPYPDKRAGFAFNYIDEGDHYLLLNCEPANGSTAIDIRITYTAPCRSVMSELVDSASGQFVRPDGTLGDQPEHAPVEVPYEISIDTDGDGTADHGISQSLFTETYKRHVTQEYTVSYSTVSYNTNASVWREWNGDWGDVPADAEDYYYVKWSHGSFYGSGVNAGRFQTTSREWVPDAYETAYETEGYVITRHRYSDLTNGKTTLYKTEVSTGEWNDGEPRTERHRQSHAIDFYVPEPTVTSSSDRVTSLSGSKWMNSTTRLHSAGQDRLLDDQDLETSKFRIDASGPSEENLERVADTSLYKAREYTLVIRDGDPGDVCYTSNRIGNRMVRLGDNDYRFTRVSVSMGNADGYRDSEGWHRLTNTAYTSWAPVEVWVRRVGEEEYYRYTDIRFDSSASRGVDLPSDTVGYELRHTTTYWGTSISAYPVLRILPSEHVRNLIQPDYDQKLSSSFYNNATIGAERGYESLMSRRSGDYVYANKSKTGLRVTKSVGTASMNTLGSIETVPVTTSAYQHNDSGMRKPIYSGTFYELLPKGTYVDESSVYAEAGGRLDRSHVNVEFVSDWQGTHQTMMLVSVGLPDTARQPEIRIHYDITNTFENVQSQGLSGYAPSAFVNTSARKEPYELQKSQALSSVEGGDTLYGELEDAHGDYVAYATSTVTFKEINAFTLGFEKAAQSEGEYAEQTVVLPNTEYRYRLSYSQSEYVLSDSIVFYDFLESGSQTAESEWSGRLLDVDVSGFAATTSENGKCAPVIHYSTKERGQFGEGDYDLSSDTWTTTRPEEGVTAVAIDCSKTVTGEDFVLSGQKNMIAYLTMLSPIDEAAIGRHAVNEAVCSSRTYYVTDPENKQPVTKYSSTGVLMRDAVPSISLSSEVPSGTEADPTLVAYEDTITYDIAITNNDTLTYRNLVFEDMLPSGVTPDAGDIRVYTTDRDRAIRIFDSSRAEMASDGNRYEFSLHELLPGETIHVLIPTIVGTREGVIPNQAKLLSVNAFPKEIETETTWHEVRRYPVSFHKRILGTGTTLPGATLELRGPDGKPLESWVSGETGHELLLGAGEYMLSEPEPPDGYAAIAPMRITIERDGRMLVDGTAQADGTVVAYDKYTDVDTVISNQVTGEGADLDRAFEYAVSISGLRPDKTYHAGDTSFTANRRGEASVTIELRHGESVTLESLPSGAVVRVTQAGSEYDGSYKVMLDGSEEASGETILPGQDLVTEPVTVDVDDGVRHIDFLNRLDPGISVRFVVVDDGGTPIVGSQLRLDDAPQQPVMEWTSTDVHKAIRLAEDGSYALTQISVPEAYDKLENPISLEMSAGTLTADVPGVVSGNATDGFVVTIRNPRKACVTVRNFATDTEYFLAGAEIEARRNDTIYHAWTSSGEEGEVVYLVPGDYVLVKTQPAYGYEAKRPSSVTVHVGEDRSVTVEGTEAYEKGIVTLYDKPRMLVPTQVVTRLGVLGAVLGSIAVPLLLVSRRRSGRGRRRTG